MALRVRVTAFDAGRVAQLEEVELPAGAYMLITADPCTLADSHRGKVIVGESCTARVVELVDARDMT